MQAVAGDLPDTETRRQDGSVDVLIDRQGGMEIAVMVMKGVRRDGGLMNGWMDGWMEGDESDPEYGVDGGR